MSQSQSPQDQSRAFQLCIDVEVVFQVADVLFSLPRSQLLTSEFFREMLSSDHIGNQDEGTKENPIVLEGITLSQVTRFCKIACSRRFESPPDLTLKEWSEAFQIATLWRFKQLRAYILKNMDSMAKDPFDRIQIADDYGLTDWLYPAYAKLCARDASLTFEEGRRIGFERFAVLVKIREDDFKDTIRTRNGSFGTPVFAATTTTFGTTVYSNPHVVQTPEPRTNCTSECYRLPFQLSTREKSFLKKIAREKALQAEGTQ